MILWVFGILFFVLTYGPRFFRLENFGFGYLDLGLYCQLLGDMKAGFLNPYIPVYQDVFYHLRPQPLMILLWPFALASGGGPIPASFLLFLDEACIIIAAAICANFTWRKTHSRELTVAIFVCILFSSLNFTALHGGALIEIWAQPFLALVFTEYFSRRRPLQMALFSGLLCLLNLNFFILCFALGLMGLVTQRERWNLQRRSQVSLLMMGIALVAFTVLHFMGSPFYLQTTFFWVNYKVTILKWLACFAYLAVLVPDALFLGVLLLLLNLRGVNNDGSILVCLGALSCVVCLERFKLTKHLLFTGLSSLLIALSVYFNLTGPDPFFTFWQPSQWMITEDNQKVHDIISHIPTLDTLAASEGFTPFLGERLTLRTLGTVNWRRNELPHYILTRNEEVTDPRYAEIEGNPKTKTRLLAKIK
jgi:hypothetical protein